MNPNYTGMTIPEQLCVAVTDKNKSVATKYVKNNNGSRMATLKSKMKKDTKNSIIDNVPYAGFVISKIDNYHWSVKDPRGFELMIPESNILDLINISIIDKGEIISKCVWTWKRSLYLVSVDDPDYDQLLENTERLTEVQKKCSELTVGDIIITGRGETMEYMGSGSVYYKSRTFHYDSTKKFWFKVLQDSRGNKPNNNRYDHRSGGCKVTVITPSDGTKNEVDSLKEILESKGVYGGYPTKSLSDVNVNFKKTKISVSSTNSVLYSSMMKDDKKLMFKVNDDYVVIDSGSYSLNSWFMSPTRGINVRCYFITQEQFDNNDFKPSTKYSIVLSNHYPTNQKKFQINHSDITEYYKLESEVTINGIEIP